MSWSYYWRQIKELMNSKKSKATKRMAQKKANNRRKARRLRAIRGLATNRRTSRMPAAFSRTFSKQWRILSQDATSMTVSGRDLIYQIPDSLAGVQGTNLMTFIPANPAYWTGTRMASMAAAYQNYRPISLSITYVPHCGSTQVGTVIGGTIWQQAPQADALQQTLQTSNGGFMTQAFMTITKNITLGSNLQKNLYQVSGDLSVDSNPFTFMAVAQGCYDEKQNRIVPGYFFITYKYVLKNPIGTNVAFYSSGIKTVSEISQSTHRVILMATPPTDNTLNPDKIPIGTAINVDTVYDQDNQAQTAFFIDGTEIALMNNALIWEFANTPTQEGGGIAPVPTDQINYEIIYQSTGTGDGRSMQVSLGAILYIVDAQNEFIEARTYIATGSSGVVNWTHTVPQGATWYIVLPQSHMLNSATYQPERAFIGGLKSVTYLTGSTSHIQLVANIIYYENIRYVFVAANNSNVRTVYTKKKKIANTATLRKTKNVVYRPLTQPTAIKEEPKEEEDVNEIRNAFEDLKV